MRESMPSCSCALSPRGKMGCPSSTRRFVVNMRGIPRGIRAFAYRAPMERVVSRSISRITWSAVVTPDSASFLMSEACGKAETRRRSLTAGVADRQGSRRQPQYGAASRGCLARLRRGVEFCSHVRWERRPPVVYCQLMTSENHTMRFCYCKITFNLF